MRVFSTRILAKFLRNLYIFTWLTKTLICSHVTSKKFFEFFEYLRMALEPLRTSSYFFFFGIFLSEFFAKNFRQ